MQDNNQDLENPLWKVLEVMGPIPTAIKSFLTSLGYDSYVALRSITDSELSSLPKEKGLLPGHVAVLRGYRDLVVSTSWEKLACRSRQVETQLVSRPDTPENPLKKVVLDEKIEQELLEKFRARLAQWVKVDGNESHKFVQKNDFQLRIISTEHERKVGAICPFCKSLIMLFYTITSKTSFKVVIANFIKHYHTQHPASNLTGSKTKQTSLLDMIKPSSSKRKADFDDERGERASKGMFK